MNKDTRKQLTEILEEANIIANGATQSFTDLKTQIEELAETEREKFDSLTEGLQAAETGQKLEQAANALDSAAEALETLTEISTQDSEDEISTAME